MYRILRSRSLGLCLTPCLTLCLILCLTPSSSPDSPVRDVSRLSQNPERDTLSLQFKPPVRWTLSPKPMDTWVGDEIWLKYARVDGEERFNAARFGLYCFFGSIVAGELLYLLRNMARYGRKFAFFNF